MGAIGAVLLGLALALQLAAVILISFKKTHRHAMRLTAAGCCLAMGAVLVLPAGLVSGRFEMEYVYKFTDTSLPLLYRFAALWAGTEGALLLYLGLISALALLLIRKEKNARVKSVIMKCFLAAQIVTQGILQAVWDPFAVAYGREEGLGLSPALQGPGMLIHPPAVIFGYALCLVPLVYLLSARSIKEIKGSHFEKCRRWAAAAWTVSTFGLLSGGIWTYAGPGQGRYWTWDPADSAGLAVWLLLTALLHCMAEENRLYHNELLLAFLTVLTTLYAAVSDGGYVLNPVYASGNYILQSAAAWVIMAAAIGAAGIYLYFGRSGGQKGKMSRAALYLSATAGLIMSGDLLAAGASRIWGYGVDRGRVLDAVFAFAGAVLLLELARHAFGKTGNVKAAGLGLAAGAAAARLAIVLSGKGILTAFAVFALTVCAAAVIQLAYGIFFLNRIKSRREYNFLLMHAALLVLAVGLTGSGGFAVSREQQLEPGQSAVVGRYLVSNAGIEYRDELRSVMAAVRMENGGKSVNLFPRLRYHEKQGQYLSKAVIRSAFLYDVYVRFDYFDMLGGARLRIILNPLASWIWAGGILLVLAGIRTVMAGENG